MALCTVVGSLSVFVAVLSREQAIDGYTTQVGQGIAARLGYKQFACVAGTQHSFLP